MKLQRLNEPRGETPIASCFIHRKVHAYKQDLRSIFGFLLLLIKLTASQKEVCGKAAQMCIKRKIFCRQYCYECVA